MIYQRDLQCSEVWRDRSFDRCTLFKTDSDVMVLVSDDKNYVVAPVTKEKYDLEIVASDLLIPFALDFLPDGTPLVTESFGNLTIGGERIDLNHNESEMFFGLAVDPEFNENGYIYAYNLYNYSEPKNISIEAVGATNRITRFKLVDNKVVDYKIVFDGISFGKFHNGGRIKFGPDGLLYIGTGDDDNSDTAQDIGTVEGSFLRINKDGSIPSDNPFGSAIWSYGHRNPQGLDWNPQTGEMYATEHGNHRMDEINIIEKGKNYGWPGFNCDIKTRRDAKYDNTEPIFCFYNEKYEGKSNYYTVAPSGGAFVTDPRHLWYGSFFFASLRGRHLHRLILDDEGNVIKNEIFLAGFGRIRDVAYNKKDGSLYIITSNTDFIKKGIHEGGKEMSSYKNNDIRDKLIKLTPT